MRIGVSKETFPGERRIALVPVHVPLLIKAGAEVWVESGAGVAAGFADEQYAEKGAHLAAERSEVLSADVVLQVRCLGANPRAGLADLAQFAPRSVVVGLCDPLDRPQAAQQLADHQVALMAMELIPRITRAQSMDVLSSMATLAGYRAVLLGALELPRVFPLLMTAAGTLTAARMLVIGAGVAGLQAIATGRRLGAMVSAYDVRAATKEQVESVGARFVELELTAERAEDQGGYARAQSDAFYARQQELLGQVVAQSDVVITTALVPGKPSPRLITAQAVEAMRPGSVIVDLAAERGGNCALTQADTRVEHRGVVVLGPTNLPSDVPHDASQMFSSNITRFVLNILDKGQLSLNLDDEIVRETLVTRDGQVVHPRIRELLGVTAKADNP